MLQRPGEILARIKDGSYPSDAHALAARLVKKGVLTTYQARHLLHGQTKGLVVGRYVILDQLGNRYGRRFDTLWDFVRYAQQQGLNLDEELLHQERERDLERGDGK